MVEYLVVTTLLYHPDLVISRYRLVSESSASSLGLILVSVQRDSIFFVQLSRDHSYCELFWNRKYVKHPNNATNIVFHFENVNDTTGGLPPRL